MEMHEIARMVRREKKMTQKDFSEMIMWGLSTYKAFEQNKISKNRMPNPTKDMLDKLAIGLGGKLTITF